MARLCLCTRVRGEVCAAGNPNLSPLHWPCQSGVHMREGTTCVLEAPHPCLWPPCLSQRPSAIHSLTEYSQTPPWARPCANLLGSHSPVGCVDFPFRAFTATCQCLSNLTR